MSAPRIIVIGSVLRYYKKIGSQPLIPNPSLKREVGNWSVCNSLNISRVQKGGDQTPEGRRPIKGSAWTGTYRSSIGFLPRVPVEAVVAAFAYFRITCQEDWFETSASREMVPLGRL